MTAPRQVAVAILAKAPVPGLAKTRLAATIGDDAAAAVAERLLARATANAAAAAVGPVTVWATPDASHPVFPRLQREHGVALAQQCDGDLGARMARVFEHAAEAGGDGLLLIGSDVPGLDADMLRRAAAALADHDAVVVPAIDGGYVLIGLRGWSPRHATLFAGMRWSTPQVMAETRERLAAAGLGHAELPALADIDTADDLVHLPAGWLAAAVTIDGSRNDEAEMTDETPKPEQPAATPTQQPATPETPETPETPATTAPAADTAAGPAADAADAADPSSADRDGQPAADDGTPKTPTASAPEPASSETPGSADSADSTDPAGTSGAADSSGTDDDAAAADGTATAADGGAPATDDGATPGATRPPAGRPASEMTPAACAARLAELFPALFAAGRALPIKLRIQSDIQQRAPGEFGRKSLSAFLHRYTTSTAYLKALAKAPNRVGLDGEPAGEIDAAHRIAAAAEVERRQGLFEAKRTAERAAINAARREAEAAARARNAAEDGDRRDRAALLRAFESSTLTRANFCALKGIKEPELDGMLHQAWLEREQRGREMPQPAPGRDDRPARGGDRGDRPRRNDAAPRGDRPPRDRRPDGGTPPDGRSTPETGGPRPDRGPRPPRNPPPPKPDR